MAPHLESLPTEILYSCFTHFILPLAPTQATKKALMQLEFDVETGYQGQRRVLWSLCLTSRRLGTIARACLYRNLAVANGRQIVLLFRSLWNDPELRNLPRSFACPTLLTENLLVLSTANHYSLIQEEIRLDLNDPLNQHELVKDHLPDFSFDPSPTMEISGALRTLPQELVARIVDRLYRLEDILIQFPRFRRIHQPFVGIVNYDPKSMLIKLASRFGCIWGMEAVHASYPTIKSFRIQQAFQTESAVETGIDHLDPFFWKPLRGVEVFECQGDDGDWMDLLGDQTNARPGERFRGHVLRWTETRKQAWYSSLKDLRLYRSRTVPSSIYHLLKRCHNLRSLHWTFDKDEWRRAQDMREDPDISLSDALLQGADKLESLYVESLGELSSKRHRIYDIEAITCLPQFQNLRNLTIDTLRLWGGKIISTDIEEGAPFTALLPPSLSQLQLIERWSGPQNQAYSSQFLHIKTESGPHHISLSSIESTAIYNSWLRIIFERSSKECKVRLPKLRTFTFRAHHKLRPQCGSRAESQLRNDEYVEEIEQLFKRVGVDFRWEWEYYHLLKLKHYG